MKPQSVRLLDVFVLGPFMIWSGHRARRLPGWARAGLVLAGLGTVAYNAQNYLALRNRSR